jgi:hypothetical protein
MKTVASLPAFALAFALALVLDACASTQSPPPTELTTGGHSNRVSLYAGKRDLDKDDYDPVDRQNTLGLEYVRETPGSIVGFEVGAMGSEKKEHESGFDVKGRTGEIYAGLHKGFGYDVVRGYVGAGVSYIQSKIDVEGVGDDDDASLAGYVHGGITADLGTSAYIGLDLRYLFGSSLTLAGVDTDANYVQLALVLGVAF